MPPASRAWWLANDRGMGFLRVLPRVAKGTHYRTKQYNRFYLMPMDSQLMGSARQAERWLQITCVNRVDRRWLGQQSQMQWVRLRHLFADERLESSLGRSTI